MARLEVGRATAGVEVACTAENELSALPVTSNHRTLGVKCKQTRQLWIMSPHYSHCTAIPQSAPARSTSTARPSWRRGRPGPTPATRTRPTRPPTSACPSSVLLLILFQIFPAFILTLHFTTFPADQRGSSLPTQLSVSPKMKGSAGFSSRVDFKFQVSAAVESVVILCSAENSENAVTEQWPVNVKSKICLWRVV